MMISGYLKTSFKFYEFEKEWEAWNK